VPTSAASAAASGADLRAGPLCAPPGIGDHRPRLEHVNCASNEPAGRPSSEILAHAQEKVHADIAPVLNETIRPWVPRITRGRYDDIRVNPATLEIEAHEAGGQFRAATVLSHGTTEQLFLLLRLALAQRLTTTNERAPIVLDDITVQSDADRTLAALDLLHDLSAEHQVVLFSQEDEVLRWAERRLKTTTDSLIQLTGP
jgi:DNA repair protein SbcC/Rad50